MQNQIQGCAAAVPLEERIEVRFAFTEVDFVKSWRLHLRWRAGIWYRMGGIGLAAFIALACWAIWGFSALWVIVLAFCVFYASMNMRAYLIEPRKNYSRTEHGKDWHLGITGEGLTFQAEGTKTESEWKQYRLALIGPESYLLYSTPAKYTVIPKRVFTDKQRELFEKLASGKISNVLRAA